MRLRSKVVEIEAELWDGSRSSILTVERLASKEKIKQKFDSGGYVTGLEVWNELEYQWINCPIGHYVLKGLRGEFYPCEPQALWMKYEVIDG